ncbi:AIG2 family protein [Purpureocillium lavendulum]|uniref:gamma-glutamylcyclotransferase n=1 Tax=Purpureocillium lavendulum TaxID=1247861 RepID=A0AB34FXK0_9HYPO|nr:AIG2 family protein [Purpureocillium lavendulum]
MAATTTTTTTTTITAAAAPRNSADPRPTKYYFAYGSNLHIKQMKRRCPNSRYIGHARLADHRWQINERGYANVVAADGRWVDGLVYEIDDRDETKLDVNEGVAKNAYEKRYMAVLLHRAHRALYRRPVSWIVDKGGPAAVRRSAKASERALGPAKHWEKDVLVYVSFNHVQDSAPKDEYVSRINLGLRDARALGIEDDYIRNCIRPFIPEASLDGGGSTSTTTTTTTNTANTTTNDTSSGENKGKSTARGVKRSSPARTGERSPARKGQTPIRPDQQTPLRALARTMRNNASAPNLRALGRVHSAAPRTQAPALPPRVVRRYQDVPIITVEEYVGGWERRTAA